MKKEQRGGGDVESASDGPEIEPRAFGRDPLGGRQVGSVASKERLQASVPIRDRLAVDLDLELVVISAGGKAHRLGVEGHGHPPRDAVVPG